MTRNEKFNIKPEENTRVLIAPLDWGLGHATRCIPIIKYLISINCGVIIAAEGRQLALLKEEFPSLQYTNLSGYRLTFSNNTWKTLIKIFLQIPKILIAINKENRWLKEFVRLNMVDIVISDNRYGLFNKEICSVFITHQLTIKAPFGTFFEHILRRINYRYIQQFSECWVPDFEGNNNMGGALSHPPNLPFVPVKYIGKLSRINDTVFKDDKVDVLIILSGPEPQRSIFETILVKQFGTFNKTSVLIRGLPGEVKTINNPYPHLSIYNHVSSAALNKFIKSATFIISRSGYSTVMDLIGLNKKCIFVPTPGQTEQLYLARYLSSKNICLNFSQDSFSLETAVKVAETSQFEHFKNIETGQYQKVIEDIIRSLKKTDNLLAI